ncbi:MAG: hypothetical protein ACX94C_07775 [Phycisphaerales bacterium]
MTDHLQRIVACVPVLVEAGCRRPPEYIELHEYAGEWAAMIWPEKHDDHDLREIGEYIRNDRAAISDYKVWFRETVVPHFSPAMYELDPPFYDSDDGRWYWGVHEDSGWCLDPTESFVQCLEALAEVVKAGAQEAEGERGGG